MEQTKMKTYKDWSPTQFDTKGLALPKLQNWIVAPTIQTRDSDCLERSNFDSMLEMLGGESKSVQVHRFNHWGPGWFEIILISPTAKAKIKIAQDAEDSLTDYPILNEKKFSALEHEKIQEYWEDWGYRELDELVADYFDAKELCSKDKGEALRNFIENKARYDILDAEGNFHTAHIEEILSKLTLADIVPSLLWVTFDCYEEPLVLDSKTEHALMKYDCKARMNTEAGLIDYEVSEAIAVQYVKNQEVLFPDTHPQLN